MQVTKLLVLAAGVTAVTVAACGTADTRDDGGLPAAPAVATPSTTQIAGAGAPATATAQGSDLAVGGSASGPRTAADRLVRSVSLTDTDVQALGLELEVGLDAGLLDEASIPSCDGEDFPSESHRTARYVVSVVDPAASGSLAGDAMDSEVIAYESPRWAQRALQDWRDDNGDDGCGAEGETLFGATVKDVTVGPGRSLPVADNSVMTIVLATSGAGEATGYTVFQRQGNLLTRLTLQAAASSRLADAERLATLLGRRMLTATS